VTRRLPNRLKGTLGTDDLHHRVTVDAPTRGDPRCVYARLVCIASMLNISSGFIRDQPLKRLGVARSTRGN